MDIQGVSSDTSGRVEADGQIVAGQIRATEINVYWLGTQQGFATEDEVNKFELSVKVFKDPRTARIAATRITSGSFGRLVWGLKVVPYKSGLPFRANPHIPKDNTPQPENKEVATA